MFHNRPMNSWNVLLHRVCKIIRQILVYRNPPTHTHTHTYRWILNRLIPRVAGRPDRVPFRIRWFACPSPETIPPSYRGLISSAVRCRLHDGLWLGWRAPKSLWSCDSVLRNRWRLCNNKKKRKKRDSILSHHKGERLVVIFYTYMNSRALQRNTRMFTNRLQYISSTLGYVWSKNELYFFLNYIIRDSFM